MGDMADYTLSLCSDIDGAGCDGFDAACDDGYGNAVVRTRQRTPLSCKHCGAEKVHWKKTEQGWRIHDNKTQKMHDCPHFKKQGA